MKILIVSLNPIKPLRGLYKSLNYSECNLGFVNLSVYKRLTSKIKLTKSRKLTLTVTYIILILCHERQLTCRIPQMFKNVTYVVVSF